MAVGRQLLLHNQPIKQRRVWYINLEDPKDEIERRIAAIAQHFGISAADFGGRLYVNSGRDAEIVIAREQRGELVVVKPVISAMRHSVMDNGIDVLIIDPFVASHAVSESDNGKINAVCQQWRMIAEETGCAVETVHHVRKGAQGQKSEYTADDARGASALVNAARSVRVLNRMTKEDAAKAGIEDHWSYFRVDNGKSNFARPAENTVWRRIISVALGNSRVDDPGDDVGVVVPWRWPDPFEQVTPEDVRAIQQKVSGGEWRGDARANDWVGRAVAEVLGLDPGQPSAKAAIKSMLRGWIEAGILKVVTRKDARRMNRPYVVVGKWEEAR
jgi:hypothetical protein